MFDLSLPFKQMVILNGYLDVEDGERSRTTISPPFSLQFPLGLSKLKEHSQGIATLDMAFSWI